MGREQSEIEKAIKLLKRQGYKVAKSAPIKTIKKTFEVDADLLKVFFETQERRALKVKEAIDEALREWVEK